ncbi:hypothetical protein VTN02DRAFT_1248 [Thermoascus thermophilus]
MDVAIREIHFCSSAMGRHPSSASENTERGQRGRLIDRSLCSHGLVFTKHNSDRDMASCPYSRTQRPN